jgi:hypothetical protein
LAGQQASDPTPRRPGGRRDDREVTMIVLERKLRGDRLKKGQWFFNQHADLVATCPRCGALGSLSQHEVTLLGTGVGLVSPSVECECGFHEQVALRDWEMSDAGY